VSSNGVNYEPVAAASITMASNVLVGFAVSSHNINALSTAAFDSVLVVQPPAIASQPVSLAAVPGGSVTFSVSVLGAEPLTYQWLTNGVALPGQTNSALSIASVQPADFGPYAVLISNLGGSVLSDVANLAPAVAPNLGSPSFASPNFVFSLPTEPGPTYVVEFKTNLQDPSWQPLTNLIGTGALITITDDGPTPGTKFYRIRLQ
jgi:hypothetical protein